jgi:hypothetical protein
MTIMKKLTVALMVGVTGAVAIATTNVRSKGKSGPDLLVVSVSRFDPQQTSAVSSGYRQRSEFVAPHGDDVTNFK